MKTILSLSFALLAMTSLSGCLMGDPEVDGEQRWTLRDLVRHPDLDGVFVSGHLGNYLDCRNQGYTESSDSRQGKAAPSEPAGDAAFGPAPCEPDTECTYDYAPLNCEDAQFTIELSNKGELPARGVAIERIELLDDRGRVLTTLPWISTTDANTLETFDGRVEPGEKFLLRVDFQGPQNLSEFYPDAPTGFYGGSAKLRIIITSDNEQTLRIETKSVEQMPVVAT